MFGGGEEREIAFSFILFPSLFPPFDSFAFFISFTSFIFPLLFYLLPVKAGKGNYIATCNIGGYDVGAAMTAVGWAVADRRSSAVYIPYEQQARTGQAGLWAGRFVAPWVARAKHQIN